MLQVAVISGKGGTGKTVVTAALADILPGKLAFADCDVEAANLALLLSPREKRRIPFFGMKKAVIREETCVVCGLCKAACRFNAIYQEPGGHIGWIRSDAKDVPCAWGSAPRGPSPFSNTRVAR